MEDKIQIKERKRETVEVILSDGTVMSGPRHTPVGEFMKRFQDPEKPQIVGAIVNKDLRELTYSISADAEVRPVDMANSDGARIYRRSLTFLLEVAFIELFPEWSLTIDHSVSSGAYYCHVPEKEPFEESLLVKLEERMWELVNADEPMVREKVA